MTSQEALIEWQCRLRLDDWRIAISDLAPDEDDRSSVDIDVNVNSAVIKLRDDTPASQVERRIVHELLHVRLSGVDDVFRAAKAWTPKAWADAGDLMWDRSTEVAIEALTDALTGSTRADWGPSGEPWNSAFPPLDTEAPDG